MSAKAEGSGTLIELLMANGRAVAILRGQAGVTGWARPDRLAAGDCPERGAEGRSETAEAVPSRL